MTRHRSQPAPRPLGALLSAVLLVIGATPMAEAAQTPQTSEPQGDSALIITLQTENDIVGRSDRNYTAGLRLGITLPTGVMPAFVSAAGHALLGDGTQRLSLDLSQTLFTPRDTNAVVPNPRDRPYAAVLTSQFNLVQDTDRTRTLIGLGLGVLGPFAQGEALQNGFHDLIRDPAARGWSHQIRNMPVVQIVAARIWRLPIVGDTGDGLEVDVVPSIAGAVGTWRDYAQVGGQIRIGQGLKSDYGTSRISPGLTGADAYTPTRDFVWYVFAGGDGQAVAWDATLDGNEFSSGPRVNRNWFVGEMEAGFATVWHGVRFSYTHVFQTQEFRGQRGGLFQFGSFTIAARF